MNQNLQSIIAAADDFGLDIPPAVAEAVALRDAADALVTTVRAETAPDLEQVTPATLIKVHAAAVAYDTAHAARLRHAETLATLGASRVDAAWTQALHAIGPGLAAGFDGIAAEFSAELDRFAAVDADTIAAQRHNPTYTRLHELADRLTQLARVRDEYTAATNSRPRVTVSDKFEIMTRTVRLDNANTAINPPDGMRASQGRGIAYWIAADRTPGVAIKWQSAAEQEQQPGARPYVEQRVKAEAMTAERLAMPVRR